MNQSFAFFCAFLFVSLPIQSIATDTWQGKVANVVDGATLDIAKPDGATERVKLYAVTVPGQGKPLAEKATQRTTSWCHQWGDVAEVQPMGQGADGQAVARVIVGQEDLAGVLTKACLASVDMALCRKRFTPECVGWQAWELQCRDQKRGLWASQTE